MFRKIVSNLAFSPALIGQLGFYAKRLRKEEATRRMGLIFVALALLMQSFAVFSPPESANAANADNIVYSGIRSQEDLLTIYDRGTDTAGRDDIQQIYSQFGITRADITNTQLADYTPSDFDDQLQVVGRSNWGVSYRYPVAITGTDTTVYTGDRLHTTEQNRTVPALVGTRTVDGAWFAITLDGGNIAYTTTPPSVTPTQTTCSPQHTPSDTTDCSAHFELTKTVRNLTQSLDDAHNTTALPGDRLQYTLTAKNISTEQRPYIMSDTVTDILEYATIVNIGDGSINDQDTTTPMVVSWPVVTLDPNESIQNVIVVQVKSTVPAMATNLSNSQSYNCKMTNTFGNTLHVRVDCPPEKVIEQVVTELPQTGAGENMLFSTIVIAFVVYFYARARQTATEVRLIRRDVNAGTI